MFALLLSVVAFFVAGHYLKRYLDEQGLPRGLTRSVLVFSLALAVAYGVEAVVSRYLA